MNNIQRNGGQRIIYVSTQSTPAQNISKNHLHGNPFTSDIIPQKNNMIDQKVPSRRGRDINEQHLSSASKIRSKKRKMNQVAPTPTTLNTLKTQKDFKMDTLNFETKHCSLPLWILLLLLYCLLVLLAVIAIVIVGVFTANKATSSSTSTSTGISITNTATLCSSSATNTTYNCPYFKAKGNWDYSGNDITSQLSLTFANCCAWCLNVTSCVAFTYNPWNTCYIKTSTGTGGSLLLSNTAAVRC